MTALLRKISFAFLVIFPLLEIGCYALLRWRRNDLAIRKRNKWAIIFASLAGWLAYFNLIVSLFGGVPCGLFYVISLLVAPTSVGPQLVRALNLKGTLVHSKLVTEELLASEWSASPLVPVQSRDNNTSNGRRGSRSSRLSDSSEKRIEANLILMKTKILVKVTILALVAVPTLVLVVAFAFTNDAGNLLATDYDQCHSHSQPNFLAFLTPAFGIASTALAFLATILIRKARDELGLRKEILRNVIFLGVTYIVILIIRLYGYDEWQPLLQTMQQMFLSFSMIVVPCLSAFEFIPPTIVAKQHSNASTAGSSFPGYAQPIPRSSIIRVLPMKQEQQRSREKTVSWDAGLCILLSTQEGINTFSQHCAREFSSENVRFWVDVNEYKAKFDEESCSPSSADTDDETEPSTSVGKISESEIYDMARFIYASYVEDTEHQINLSSKLKLDLKRALDSKQLSRGTFDAAQKEIFDVMARDSYPRYLAASKRQRLKK